MYYSARNLAVEKEWHNEVGHKIICIIFYRKLKSAFDLTRKDILIKTKYGAESIKVKNFTLID